MRVSFVLTSEEKKALIFVLIAFALGLATMHYRGSRPQVAPEIQSKAKPSAADTDE